RPWQGYADILPNRADVARIAYHFDGDYASASREDQDLVGRLRAAVREWRRCWNEEDTRPTLEVTRLSDEDFVLVDSRGLPGTAAISFLTRAQASLVLAGARGTGAADAAWALEQNLLVEMDGGLVPLATADPALIEEFESELRGPDIRARSTG